MTHASEAPVLFEITHEGTVLTIRDDWSGHPLVTDGRAIGQGDGWGRRLADTVEADGMARRDVEIALIAGFLDHAAF